MDNFKKSALNELKVRIDKKNFYDYHVILSIK